MRALVLVDVDNVLVGANDATRTSEAPRVCLDDRLRRGVTSYVVCFGLNTVSARRGDWGDLYAVARALLGLAATAAPPVALEVGLTLPMPEAVDQALVRLAHHAPCEAHAGRYDRVVLLSRDTGLRTQLSRALATPLRGQQACFSANVTLHRAAPAPAIDATSTTPTPPAGDVSRPLETIGQCAWAAGRSPEATGDLRDIATEVEVYPWLLSQLGPTLRSTRGVARLSALVQGRATTLACCPDDGVEVRSGDEGAWPWAPTTPFEVAETSVGDGTVRVSWRDEDRHVSVVARTRLPIDVLRDVAASSGTLRTGIPCVLDDLAILADARHLLAAELLTGSPPPDRRHVFEFKRQRHEGTDQQSTNHLLVEITQGASWWWSRAKGRARVTKKCRVATRHWEPIGVHVSGVVGELRRARMRGTPELIFVAPVDDGATVKALQATALHTIGKVTDGVNDFALLALGGPVAAGAELQVVPVQRVEHDTLRCLLAARAPDLDDDAWVALRRLPLVVPLDAALDASAAFLSEPPRLAHRANEHP